MRRTKAETAESRRQILEQAARLFREHGTERVSLDEVMEAAGMTRGGFYKHFSSKEDLFAATLDAAFAEKLAYLDELSAKDAGDGVRRYLDGYLTLGHVEDRAGGCAIVGFTPDATRASPDAQAALSGGTEMTLEKFAAATGSEAEAIRTLSCAIGAIVLARAVQRKALKRRILDAARSACHATIISS